MKSIAIFGSTGSIGRQTIDIIQHNPDRYRASVLVGGKNIKQLAEQAKMMRPDIIVCAHKEDYSLLRDLVPQDMKDKVFAGRKDVIDAAQFQVDMHMAAITGAAGLEPIFAAVKKSIPIALANKEALVCAGSLLMEAIEEYGTQLLPVDSEHSAIFQCWEEHNKKVVDHVILTASGGPFRLTPFKDFKDITVASAIAHPNWSMGKKISVDSATMVNKSLELIEACHLFGITEDKIQIVIHPQSIMHSAVAYQDGSTIAHLGYPDMRVPIAAALSWPKRIKTPVESLNLTQMTELSFEEPDMERFPVLNLVRSALREGQGATIIFNAANEVAVQSFLEEKIHFTSIIPIIEKTLQKMQSPVISSLEDVLRVDHDARKYSSQLISDIYI